MNYIKPKETYSKNKYGEKIFHILYLIDKGVNLSVDIADQLNLNYSDITRSTKFLVDDKIILKRRIDYRKNAYELIITEKGLKVLDALTILNDCGIFK